MIKITSVEKYKFKKMWYMKNCTNCKKPFYWRKHLNAVKIISVLKPIYTFDLIQVNNNVGNRGRLTL